MGAVIFIIIVLTLIYGLLSQFNEKMEAKKQARIEILKEKYKENMKNKK